MKFKMASKMATKIADFNIPVYIIMIIYFDVQTTQMDCKNNN